MVVENSLYPFNQQFLASLSYTHTQPLAGPTALTLLPFARSFAPSLMLCTFCAILIYNNMNVTNMQQNKITLCKITPNHYSSAKWISYSQQHGREEITPKKFQLNSCVWWSDQHTNHSSGKNGWRRDVLSSFLVYYIVPVCCNSVIVYFQKSVQFIVQFDKVWNRIDWHQFQH